MPDGGNGSISAGSGDASALLLPHHAQLIGASAISPGVATARGYRSVTRKAELKRLGFGDVQLHVPGLLIPIWGVDGQIGSYQLRPDQPRVRQHDGKVRTIKYETIQGSRMMLDVPPPARPWLGDPKRPLFITEGVRKADAAVSKGLCCVDILGVWNWRGTNEDGGKTALPDWESIALNGRQVYLAFDSDVTTKPDVAAALRRLRSFLGSRGARVRIIYLPTGEGGAKMGLDDYLAAGYTVHDLLSLARDDLERTDQVDERLPLTDMGNARRLVARHGSDLLYCHLWGKWIAWDGRRWQVDATAEVERRGKEVIRNLLVEAAESSSDDERTELAKWAIQCQQVRRLRSMLEWAQSEPEFIATPDDFDRDPWLLNVVNGTLDLRTAELRPHRREDRITKVATTVYDPDARCPTWDAFLDRIMDGKAELIAFLQRAVGYSLTGVTHERVVFILWGVGRNGKSTFLNTVRELLGEYGMRTPTETLMTKGEGAIPNDLARLQGARYVTAAEASQGRRLDESLVKDVTGGEPIAARFMRGEWFEYRPQFKLWLGTNHKPQISGTDKAIWDRIRLVPFTVRIPDEEQDPGLPARLRSEMPGILRWAVEGCLTWQREGLRPPREVREATEGYRSEMDAIGGFLEECCQIQPGASEKAADIYRVYKGWAERTGERVMSQRSLGLRLAERGFADRRGHGGVRQWTGLRLTVDEEGRPRPIQGDFEHMPASIEPMPITIADSEHMPVISRTPQKIEPDPLENGSSRQLIEGQGPKNDPRASRSTVDIEGIVDELSTLRQKPLEKILPNAVKDNDAADMTLGDASARVTHSDAVSGLTPYEKSLAGGIGNPRHLASPVTDASPSNDAEMEIIDL
ncbi:MAG: phage/plasmid primase, P4 family [Sphingomonadaceae bacterium]